jgi:hypothetical protein
VHSRLHAQSTNRKLALTVARSLKVVGGEGCVVQDPEERAARNTFIEGDEHFRKTSHTPIWLIGSPRTVTVKRAATRMT